MGQIKCDKCREKKEEAFEIFGYHFCEECRDDLNVITIHWVMNMCEFMKPKPKKTKPTYIDWDKACALKIAGWSNANIAEEIGITQKALADQISKRVRMYQHGMRWGAPAKRKEADPYEW